MFVNSTNPERVFDFEDQELLQILAGYMSVVLNEAATLETVRTALGLAEWQASHDPLTDLPNRRMVRETIDRWLAQTDVDKDRTHLLFVDLDRFKTVNDLYGHATGDRVILEAADRLRRKVRPSDLVGRLAGDEFVVCASGLDDRGAVQLAERLAADLSDVMTIGGRSVRLSATIGVASAGAAHDADELLAHADIAMYQAKTNHRGTVGFFDDHLQRQTRKRVALETRLKDAVPTMEDFALLYQPIVDLATGALRGYEALLRWSDPDLGAVSPAVFVPVAEETDLIVGIDRWVLHEAVHEAATWRSPSTQPITLSVNVSAATFTHPEFTSWVAQTLASTGLPAARLSLEITERVMLSNLQTTSEVVEALRAIGCRVVLDDFGTGYSSLAYLRHFPVDALKIDRSFVTDLLEPGASALVEAIVAMAGALGCEAIAEGVEEEAQFARLAELGCDMGQGWLWGRAAEPAVIREQIADPAGLRGPMRVDTALILPGHRPMGSAVG